jgi:hypothetical protein
MKVVDSSGGRGGAYRIILISSELKGISRDGYAVSQKSKTFSYRTLMLEVKIK